VNNKKLYLTAVLYTFFTLFLFTFNFEESVKSIRLVNPDFSVCLDKFFHLLIFLFLYFIWFYSLKKSSIISKFILFLSLSIYGLIIELIQLKLPHRSFEFIDIIFNTTGLLVSLILIRFQDKNFKK